MTQSLSPVISTFILITTTDHFANQFTDMLSTFDFTQHTAGPTHNQGHTLDLVISKGLDITLNCTLDVGISDHFCIFFNVAWVTKHVPGLKSVKRCSICADTPDKFIARYTNSARGTWLHSGFNSDFTSVFNLSSLSLCDNLVNNFNLSVTHILDDIAPVKTKIIPGKSKAPWRNVERVKALKRTCRKFERKWRKTKLQADHILYKDLLSKYNKEIKTSRQHYFSQIISENLNNSKFLFSTIDKLISPLRPIPAELHSSEKCNKVASYLKSKIINNRNKIMASAGASDLSSSTHFHSAILPSPSPTSLPFKVMSCKK